MEEEFNPYAAPKGDTFAAPVDAKHTRLAHLGTESHLKALGVLWLCFGLEPVLSLFVEVVLLGGQLRPHLISDLPTVIVACLAGIGLCRLQWWGWVLCVLSSGVFLLFQLTNAYLLGVIIAAIILRFLLRKDTRRVVAADYPSVVAATPELHSPVARWGWWVSGILTLLAGANYFRILSGWW
ncbi:MAG TPA: hypothetical protein VGE29_16630 [Prosthecobacter sp.]